MNPYSFACTLEKRHLSHCSMQGEILRTLFWMTFGCLGQCVAGDTNQLSQLTTLVSFTGPNGANPTSALVQTADGSFYGTTSRGGASNLGTVFRLHPDGTLETLYSFVGSRDGAKPVSGLVQGPDGFFYGTTVAVGSYLDPAGTHTGFGTIFKVSNSGALTTLFAFSGTNGFNAWSAPPLILDSKGTIFGMTLHGGASPSSGSPSFGPGTVFQLDPSGALRTLCTFDGITNSTPYGGLTLAPDGTLYGATSLGGGGGNIFQINSQGILKNLASFQRTNGYLPGSSLLLAADGNLYGTTLQGGENVSDPSSRQYYGFGTVFRLSPTGRLDVMFSFDGTNNGAFPHGALIQASDGNLYGTFSVGGTTTNVIPGDISGPGGIFSISMKGTFKTTHWFNGTDGASPMAALVQGADGAFYGTTSGGGPAGLGTIFRLLVPLPPALQVASVSPAGIQLTWNASIGQNYQVQYTTDLANPLWNNVGTLSQATNSIMSLRVPPTEDLRRFYRIQWLP